MMLDLSRLSPEQRQAVVAGDGPLLIVAGPGSGKTTVLTARIAYLVTVRQIPPSSILAITFATKAARELRARLSGMLGEQGTAVDVMTFHAFGLRIIRQWAEELGFRSDRLKVLDDGDARRLLQEAATGLGFDLERTPVSHLTAKIERHRLGHCDTVLPEHLQSLLDAYEHLLLQRDAVDYPAMLLLPLQLFASRRDALRLYQDTYRYVLVDEFQDVCASQNTLLRRVTERHHNLIAVGDPCQTLYGWRGAEVRFMLDFPRDVANARVMRLNQNFRSTEKIVDLANALSAPLPYSRPLWTNNPPGTTALIHMATDEPAEAAFVADEIERLAAERCINHPGEVAVLYRTNQQAQHLTVALRRHGLPYEMRGTGDLFRHREVRDIIAYLRLAQDPEDGAALSRVINVPPRRLARLVAPLRAQPVSAGELPAIAAHLGPPGIASAEALTRLITELHVQSTVIAPVDLLDEVLKRTGYREWLIRQPDGAERLSRLATLRDLAESAESDLGTWLAELQLDVDLPVTDDVQRVVLTTIHGAKGGEWRVVFVVGIEDGILPHARTLKTASPQDSTIEEELRIAYVAVTRPRERLYLTCCRTRQRGERREPCLPSRFLSRLPASLLAWTT